MEMVTLRNLRSHELVVPGTGGELVFGARGTNEAELALDPQTAEDCLDRYGRDAFDYVDLGSISSVYTPPEKPATVWIANMTGNPDAPQVVAAGKMKNRETGLVEEVKVENVNKASRPLRFVMKGAQGYYKDKDGIAQGYNKLPTVIEIPAHQRREVSKPIGQWILTRDALAPAHERGAVIKS